MGKKRLLRLRKSGQMKLSRRHIQNRERLCLDELLAAQYNFFATLPDVRNRTIGQSIADICQAGFALFHLKFPSLLDFDTMTTVQRENLRRVYQINSVCSDTQMRRVLDPIDPQSIWQRVNDLWVDSLNRLGVKREYALLGDACWYRWMGWNTLVPNTSSVRTV